MARPYKRGLSYFSLDSNIFYADDNIKGLIARFGPAGIALYLYVLCGIYREEGYYKEINADFEYIASMDLNIQYGTVGEIMDFLYDRRLLYKRQPAFRPDGVVVITSQGIQKRYQLAVAERARRRAIIVDPGVWMLPPGETSPYIKFSADAAGDASHAEPENSSDVEDIGPFTSETVEAEFQDYLAGRGGLRPPQVSALRGKLQELSTEPAEQVAIIKEATIHGWKSFYPLKKDKPRKGGKEKPAFYNYEQRTYDYKKLEAQLLGSGDVLGEKNETK